MADVDSRATAAMMFDSIVGGWNEGPFTFWLHRRIFWIHGEYAAHPDDETITPFERQPGWRRGSSSAVPLAMTLYGSNAGLVGRQSTETADETAAREWRADVAAMKDDGYQQTGRTVSDDLLAWEGERADMRVTIVMLRPSDAARADDQVVVELASMLREAQPEMRGVR